MKKPTIKGETMKLDKHSLFAGLIVILTIAMLTGEHSYYASALTLLWIGMSVKK